MAAPALSSCRASAMGPGPKVEPSPLRGAASRRSVPLESRFALKCGHGPPPRLAGSLAPVAVRKGGLRLGPAARLWEGATPRAERAEVMASRSPRLSGCSAAGAQGGDVVDPLPRERLTFGVGGRFGPVIGEERSGKWASAHFEGPGGATVSGGSNSLSSEGLSAGAPSGAGGGSVPLSVRRAPMGSWTGALSRRYKPVGFRICGPSCQCSLALARLLRGRFIGRFLTGNLMGWTAIFPMHWMHWMHWMR